jgi:hypothetical protein
VRNIAEFNNTNTDKLPYIVWWLSMNWLTDDGGQGRNRKKHNPTGAISPRNRRFITFWQHSVHL